MSNRKIWTRIVAGLAVLVFASVAWPLIVHSRRPNQLSFKIQNVYIQTAKVEDAFNVSGMTRNFVVSEGPCAGGCNGGILSQQFPVDAKVMIPNLKGYDGESTTIIWLYQVKPIKVTRHNDLFGDDTVTITGKSTKEQKVYFALVPKRIVEPHLQWIYVEIK